MSTRKIRFVVLDENVFGCIYPQQPLSMQILSSSVVRGATVTWHNGTHPLPLDPAWVRSSECPKPLPLDGSHPVKLDPKRVRPATRADFTFFRMDANYGYKDPAHYDYPSA